MSLMSRRVGSGCVVRVRGVSRGVSRGIVWWGEEKKNLIAEAGCINFFALSGIVLTAAASACFLLKLLNLDLITVTLSPAPDLRDSGLGTWDSGMENIVEGVVEGVLKGNEDAFFATPASAPRRVGSVEATGGREDSVESGGGSDIGNVGSSGEERMGMGLGGGVDLEEAEAALVVDWGDARVFESSSEGEEEEGGEGVKAYAGVQAGGDVDESHPVVRAYVAACREARVTPVARVLLEPDVEVLDLEHFGLGPRGMVALAAGLEKGSKTRALVLGDNWVGEEGAAALGRLFSAAGHISSARLDGNAIGRGAIPLFAELDNNQTLTELDMSGNGLGDDEALALADLLDDNHTLVRVNVSRNEIGSQGAYALGMALENNSMIESFDLAWNSIRLGGAKMFARALAQHPSLASLNLAWNGLDDAPTALLGKALRTAFSLTYLNLASNRFGPRGAKALFDGVKVGTLETLILDGNALSDQKLSSERALLAALEENQSLSTLSIKGILIADDVRDSLAQIVHDKADRLGKVLTIIPLHSGGSVGDGDGDGEG